MITYISTVKNWTLEQKKDHDDFLILNPHYVVKHNIFLLRDLSGNNPENIPPLEDGEYPQFMLDVNSAIRMGPIILSIYTDSSGIGMTLDSNGNPIQNRFLKQTSYTYPYINNDGVYIPGILTCTFGDGSSFSNDDLNNTAYWYLINGVSNPNNLQQYT
jgi:hypothetical protein